MDHKIVYSNCWVEKDENGVTHYYFGYGCELCGRFFPGEYDAALQEANLPNNACTRPPQAEAGATDIQSGGG